MDAKIFSPRLGVFQLQDFFESYGPNAPRPSDLVSVVYCTPEVPGDFRVFNRWDFRGKPWDLTQKQWDDLGFRIQKLRKLWDFQTHSCGLATTHADLTHEDLVVDHRLKPELPPKKMPLLF